jgi:hypothetical protein
MSFQDLIKEYEHPSNEKVLFDLYMGQLTTTEDSLDFINKCLTEMSDLKLKYRALMRVTNILLDKQRSYSPTYDPNLDSRLVAFQRFMDSWNWLIAKVPGDETKSLKIDGIKLLEELLSTKKIIQFEETKAYKDFMAVYRETYKKLRETGDYLQLEELMDG